MSTKDSGIRKPLYLSEVNDTDILKYLEPLVAPYKFSAVIKELIRDGMKFREGGRAKVHSPTPTPPRPEVIQSDTPIDTTDLSDLVLETKEISKEELENRLDNF